MAIVFNCESVVESSLNSADEFENAAFGLSGNALLQEYVDHNCKIYKVYVMGDFVFIAVRPSLPNLGSLRNAAEHVTSQTDTESRSRFLSAIVFDSQSSFDKVHESVSNMQFVDSESKEIQNTEQDMDLTLRETLQIASFSLRELLGLTLFGFDVLQSCEDNQPLLIVDINYFPSYKEVDDLPRRFRELFLKIAQGFVHKS